MRHLSLGEVVDLHQALVDQSGDAAGIRDVGTVDEHERLMLELADARISREQLTSWLEEHTKKIAGGSAV